jgi:hypothetical protein
MFKKVLLIFPMRPPVASEHHKRKSYTYNNTPFQQAGLKQTPDSQLSELNSTLIFIINLNYKLYNIQLLDGAVVEHLFVPGKPFQPSLMFVSEGGAYPGASL